MEVSPQVEPYNVAGIHGSIANVDASRYGVRCLRSADKGPSIGYPQCLPDVDDTPYGKREIGRCDLKQTKSVITNRLSSEWGDELMERESSCIICSMYGSAQCH